MTNQHTLIILIILCTFTMSCSHLAKLYNYSNEDSPKYSSTNPKEYKSIFTGDIKVASYNIKHSKKTDEAIALLKNNKHLASADILLLQEMTPLAVKKIADSLGYNYVFYPAIFHPGLHTDFGNAILSKWILSDDHKVILPPITHKTRQRIAVAATVTIGDIKIKVYSIHMGIFIKPDARKRMVSTMLYPMNNEIDYYIVGGDFNSFTKKDRKNINESFKTLDFDFATENTGWTYNQWYFFNRKSPLDHIYTKGMKIISSGKVTEQQASDHLPVWAELKIHTIQTAQQSLEQTSAL